MGLMDRMKANCRVTQLSWMTFPQQIAAACQSWSPEERAAVLRGIESTFKWAPVAQIAQGMFAQYFQPSGGVSPESVDMVIHGQVEGGLALMRQENQQQASTMQWGLTPAQQAALSYAWTVLKAMEQREMMGPTARAAAAAAPEGPAAESTGAAPNFCSQCGSRVEAGARFCARCGHQL
jgi:hypothetical protein